MPVFAGSSSACDETERAFLQGRIRLFAKVAFFISLGADLYHSVAAESGELLGWLYFLDYLVTAMFAAIWLICARLTLSVRLLRTVEAAGLVGISLVIALLGRYLPVYELPIMVRGSEPSARALPVLARVVDGYASIQVILGGAITFAIRAALIPSRPRFTLVLTAIAGVPFVLTPLLLAPATGGRLALRPSPGPPGAAWDYALWWAIVTASCTVVSSVIYGLRRDVRHALRLGQYTLRKKLGEGGMGAVYRARHTLLRRPTAVKLLLPERTGEESLARFEREVQLTATLTHPNTITIYDYGRTPDGVLYYAMELVDGPTLQELVELDGPQPPERVAHILAQAAGALAEAHASGLIHRDVKPSNIMLCERGGAADVVKVVDFGLVKRAVSRADASQTNVETLKGTPHYMSPEAIRAPEEVSGLSDVYALGGVAYFMLTGETVFSGQGVVEVCGHHLHSEPTSPSERLGRPLPPALEELVLACLRKDPKHRPTAGPNLARRFLSLTGVGVWTAEDARRWWQAYQQTASAHQSQQDARSADGTIAVDFANRGLPS